MAYSRQELETIEKELLRERERVVRKLTRFQEASRTDDAMAAFSFHMADEGTDTMAREQAVMMAGDEGRRLQELDAALRRLYRDPERFGLCKECGAPIGMPRLELMPASEHCIECIRREETGGGARE